MLKLTLLLSLLTTTLLTSAQTPSATALREQMRLDILAMKGKTITPFTSVDLNNNPISSELLKGKVYVINFWFVACKPCQMEMPQLNKLVEKYKGTEVRFISIALDKADAITKFLKNTPFEYTHIPDASAIAIRDFKVHVYPTHIIVDRDNKISYSASGYSPRTVKDLDKELGKLLKR